MKRTEQYKKIILFVLYIVVLNGIITYPLPLQFTNSLFGDSWISLIPSWITIPFEYPWILNTVLLSGIIISECLYFQLFYRITQSRLLTYILTTLFFFHPWIIVQYTLPITPFIFFLFPLSINTVLAYIKKKNPFHLVLSVLFILMAFTLEFDFGLILLFIHLTSYGQTVYGEFKKKAALPFQKNSTTTAWTTLLIGSMVLVTTFFLFMPNDISTDKKQFRQITEASVDISEYFTPFHRFSDIWDGPYPYIGITLIVLLFFMLKRKHTKTTFIYSFIAISSLILAIGPWLETPQTEGLHIVMPYMLLFQYLPFQSFLHDPSLFFLPGFFSVLVLFGLAAKDWLHTHADSAKKIIGFCILFFIISAEIFVPQSIPVVPLRSTEMFIALNEQTHVHPGTVLNFQERLKLKPLEQYYLEEKTDFDIQFSPSLPNNSTVAHIFDIENSIDIFPVLSKDTSTALVEETGLRYYILHKNENNYQYYINRLNTHLNTSIIYEDELFLVLELAEGASKNEYITLNDQWSNIRRTREKQRPFRFARNGGGEITFRQYQSSSTSTVRLTLNTISAQTVTVQWKNDPSTFQKIDIPEKSSVTVEVPWLKTDATDEPTLVISPDGKVKLFSVEIQ